MPDDTRMLQAALWYAKNGWPVFPCHTPQPDGSCSCSNASCTSPGKHSRTPHSIYDATTDRVQIKDWWRDWPDANIGLACGPGVGTVLDVDAKSGGRRTLRNLIKEHGPLPDVPTVKTGGGGYHYYFAFDPENPLSNRVGIGQGLDIRTKGGLVIAPPSLHASGKRHEWQRPPQAREVLPDPPEWMKASGARPSASEAFQDGPIMEGQRNRALFNIGAALRRYGADEATILVTLLYTNQHRCKPPMDESEVTTIARQAAKYTPNYHYDEDPEYTDVGNAQRLQIRHAVDLKFTQATGWHVWDGTRWNRDRVGAVNRLAVETVQAIPQERVNIPEEDEQKKKDLGKWYKSSQAHARIAAMVNLAESLEDIATVAEVFDTDNWLFNVRNGTLNLRTGELRPHDRADMITKLAPVTYDPNATCPRFDQFIDEIMLGNRQLMTYLQRLFGYALTGVTSEEILPIFWGGGGNGKTTLLKLMQSIMGRDYSGAAPPNLLMQKRQETHPTELADLAGKRLVIASESGEGKRLAVEVVKLLTGGDTIKGRFMRMDFFEFAATHKIILMTNNKPVIRNTEHGTWRRLRLVPFNYKVAAHQIDKQLEDKLYAERSGVLNWLIKGCLDWQAHGLATPREVLAATREYREESDTLADFLRECCEFDAQATVSVEALHRTYEAWAKHHGERAIMSKSTLSRRLELHEEHPLQKKTIRNVRSWKGITVKGESITLT